MSTNRNANSSRDDRRKPGMRPLAATVPKIAAKAIGKRGFAEASLITDWSTIVGNDLAKVSQPNKLSFPPGKRTEATLHILVQGGVATELQHLEPMVIERINSHFGYGAVSRLRLIHAPLGKRPARRGMPTLQKTKPSPEHRAKLNTMLADVADDDIRNALERLGTAILIRESKIKKT